MKKSLLVSIIILFTLAVFSCKPPAQQEETKEESFGAAPVKVYKVRKQSISEKFIYTGLIEAINKADVTPEVGGKVSQIYVKEGDRVQKGQLLAELDTRAVRLQLDQAKAGQAVAKANYKDAKRNMDRMDRLSQENAVSEQQFEKVRLAFEAADAQLQQAAAALNLVRYQLDVSIMKAPFSGVIASRNVEIGDVINPMMAGYGSKSGVVTLMDFSRVKVYVYVSLKDVVRIKNGQAAYLKVSAFPEKRFPGKVAVVNLTADPITRKFRVEINADNPDMLLRPNIFGEVDIEVSSRENVLTIPQKALLEDRYVLLAENGRAIKREVIKGLQNAFLIEIVSGLKEGDLVIIEGNYGLENGAEIEVKKEVSQ